MSPEFWTRSTQELQSSVSNAVTQYSIKLNAEWSLLLAGANKQVMYQTGLTALKKVKLRHDDKKYQNRKAVEIQTVHWL
jgi:hypothetical protein